MRILAAIALALVLAGCGRGLTDPVATCVEHGDFNVCGRFGDCQRQCLRYAITCNEPLTLTTRPEDGELTCKLQTAKGD